MREGRELDDGSLTDEEVSGKDGDWRGVGKLLEVGHGNTFREHCADQTLASSGWWQRSKRRYPEGSAMLRATSGYS